MVNWLSGWNQMRRCFVAVTCFVMWIIFVFIVVSNRNFPETRGEIIRRVLACGPVYCT